MSRHYFLQLNFELRTQSQTTTMRAARIRPISPQGTPYCFPGNPAPSSAIEVHDDVPNPQITNPDELIIQVKATTVYKDNLEWNELYPPNHAQLGNDFSGVVVAVHENEKDYKIGDHVYGMTHAKTGGTWAEYAIVTKEETVRKPDSLSWEEAAALPGSAITADQALFVHAGLPTTTDHAKRILITGASGGVGMRLVEFAALAGNHVVAATSSKARHEKFLRSIGAHEVFEYSEFDKVEAVDLIIDSVGFEVLESCWGMVKPNGILISFDGRSWNYVDDHKKRGISKGKEGVQALYFIAEPSQASMARITEHVAKGNVKGLVLRTVSLNDVRAAYESAHERVDGHGKIVVLP